MSSFEEALKKIAGEDVFLCLAPEEADFTSDRSVSLVLLSENIRMTIPFPSDSIKLKALVSKLSWFLNESENKPNIIFAWNIKEMFSYFLGKLHAQFLISAKIFDIKILESYLGIEGKCPESFVEAKERVINITRKSTWDKLKIVYSSIYIPLITDIIPAIETQGVINKSNRRKLYSHYDVAGQANGRLKCSKSLREGFNPHSLGELERIVLSPPMFDHEFMYLDFKAVEVSMLQWLSGDEELGRIIESGVGMYEGIWKHLTTLDCTSTFRDMCKGIFLPVVYGQGSESLSTSSGLSGTAAEKLKSKIYEKFSTAMRWIMGQQNSLEDNSEGCDLMGRCRTFDKNYKIRNFVIQAPTALMCLNKLVVLHRGLQYGAKIAFHIHDGYVLYSPKIHRKKVRDLAIGLLEQEEEMFKGLKVQVTCKVGDNLEELIDIKESRE